MNTNNDILTKEVIEEFKKTIDSWRRPLRDARTIMVAYGDILKLSSENIDEAAVIINNDRK